MTSMDHDITPQDLKHEPETQMKFLARVTSLPLVQQGVSTIENYTIGRLVLESANTTLVTAQKYQPSVIQPLLQRADELGCRSLDFIGRADVKAYLPDLEGRLNAVYATIAALQQQGTSRGSQLVATLSGQLEAMITYVKSRDVTPEWLKARVLSMLDIAVQQYERLREEYSQLNPVDKAKSMALGIQERVVPILRTVQSHLHYYTEKADVKPAVVTAL